MLSILLALSTLNSPIIGLAGGYLDVSAVTLALEADFFVTDFKVLDLLAVQ